MTLSLTKQQSVELFNLLSSRIGSMESRSYMSELEHQTLFALKGIRYKLAKSL